MKKKWIRENKRIIEWVGLIKKKKIWILPPKFNRKRLKSIRKLVNKILSQIRLKCCQIK